ncbi:MAG: hypothetical protein KGV57_02215 [Fusobacterium sp.]|nr:hypothetical protein [Fusobacterium sp.]
MKKYNNLEIIKKICPSSISKKGELKNFQVQLLEYEYGIKNDTYPFVVELNSESLNYVGIDKKPLFLNTSTVEKIKEKHQINLSFLLDLNEVIKNSLFAFDSIQFSDSKIFVTEDKSKEDLPIIFIVREDKKAAIYLVNEITSIYDKKNLNNLIKNSLKNGGKIYLNPNKIKEIEEFSLNYNDILKEEITSRKEEQKKKNPKIPKKKKDKEVENER